MRALTIKNPGPKSTLVWETRARPKLRGENDLLIQVHAAGVNRADLLQRRGLYAGPAGENANVCGLEVSGVVLASNHPRRTRGQRVMALLSGGGYAEEVIADARTTLPIPDAWSVECAAGFIETHATVYLNLLMLGGMSARSQVLVHGGTSGIGSAALSIAKALGASIAVTAGSAHKVEQCMALGADIAINYSQDNFGEILRQNNFSPDIILDFVGGPYLEQHLKLLSQGGMLILIGLMGGHQSELSLVPFLAKGLRLVGSTLRPQNVLKKQAILQNLVRDFSPLPKALIDTVFPADEVEAAHKKMLKSEHIGKLVLSFRR